MKRKDNRENESTNARRENGEMRVGFGSLLKHLKRQILNREEEGE